MMDSISLAWKRIEDWFEKFAPASAKYFFPGAAPSEITAVEVALGLLPADLKACYQRHNGVSEYVCLIGHTFGLAPLWDLVSQWDHMLEQAVLLSAWAELVPRRLSEEASHLVQPIWWHHGWIPFACNDVPFACACNDIPFACNDAAHLYCFDLTPLPAGHVGQILEWDPEEGPVRVHSENIQTLLSNYADQLEAGLRLTRGIPFLPVERLTKLAERRAALLQPSAAKPVLYQAIRDGVETYRSEQIRSVLATYQQVLAMETASPEDRFFAYYGLFAWNLPHFDVSISLGDLFDTYQTEASKMDSSHWVHQEVALIRES